MFKICFLTAKFVLVIFLFSMMSLSAFAQADRRSAGAELEIMKVMNDQAAAWNRGDVDGFMAGYWRSSKLVFVSGVNVTRGWQPTLDRYKRTYDSREKMGVLTFSGIEFLVLKDDTAVVLGNWALAQVKGDPHGKFTLTFRKLKGGWRIVVDHTS